MKTPKKKTTTTKNPKTEYNNFNFKKRHTHKKFIW